MPSSPPYLPVLLYFWDYRICTLRTPPITVHVLSLLVLTKCITWRGNYLENSSGLDLFIFGKAWTYSELSALRRRSHV